MNQDQSTPDQDPNAFSLEEEKTAKSETDVSVQLTENNT